MAKIDNLQIGDIIMYKKHYTWHSFGRVISKITKSQYYHCTIYLGEENGIKSEAEASWRYGTVQHPLKGYGDDEIDVFRFIEPLSDDEVHDLKNAVREYTGRGYGWFAIFFIYIKERFKVNISYNDNTRYLHCSDYVNVLFNQVGRRLVYWKDSDAVTPKDISLSPFIQEVQ